MILIDPVDGNSPIPENVTMSVITPGEKVNFTVPALQLVTGFDPVPGLLNCSPTELKNSIKQVSSMNWNTDAVGVACAPEELSGRRYFDAFNGPSWYVNATAYGHLDLIDPAYVQVGSKIERIPSFSGLIENFVPF